MPRMPQLCRNETLCTSVVHSALPSMQFTGCCQRMSVCRCDDEYDRSSNWTHSNRYNTNWFDALRFILFVFIFITTLLLYIVLRRLLCRMPHTYICTKACVCVCMCMRTGKQTLMLDLHADIYNEINMLFVQQLATAAAAGCRRQAAGVCMYLNKP